MTTLIVIIFILQLILTAWAITISFLYARLLKTVQSIVKIDQSAIVDLFANDIDVTHTISAVLRSVEAVEDEVAAYKATIEEELQKSQENSEFALQTIQQARRIYRQASEIAGQPQMTIEPEEDTDEQ